MSSAHGDGAAYEAGSVAKLAGAYRELCAPVLSFTFRPRWHYATGRETDTRSPKCMTTAMRKYRSLAAVYRAHRTDPKPTLRVLARGRNPLARSTYNQRFNGFCAMPDDARRVRHERNPENCGDSGLGCGRLQPASRR